MSIYRVKCDWCDGEGGNTFWQGDVLMYIHCEECRGAGFKLKFPPPDTVKFIGIYDGASEDKDNEEEENSE